MSALAKSLAGRIFNPQPSSYKQFGKWDKLAHRSFFCSAKYWIRKAFAFLPHESWILLPWNILSFIKSLLRGFFHSLPLFFISTNSFRLLNFHIFWPVRFCQHEYIWKHIFSDPLFALIRANLCTRPSKVFKEQGSNSYAAKFSNCRQRQLCALPA